MCTGVVGVFLGVVRFIVYDFLQILVVPNLRKTIIYLLIHRLSSVKEGTKKNRKHKASTMERT